jgi:SAM-dependent methyltransferase
MQDHWERHASDWIRWARTAGHDLWYWRLNRPWFLELLPPPGRLTVDLGCGEGRLLRELAAMGHRVVGVDRAPTMARAAAQAVGGDAGVVVADAARLPLASGAADLVVAFMSLLNVDDLPAAVGEVGRVLAPGGRLCVALLHPIASAGTFLRDDPDARFVLTRSYFEPSCEHLDLPTMLADRGRWLPSTREVGGSRRGAKGETAHLSDAVTSRRFRQERQDPQQVTVARITTARREADSAFILQ